MIEISYFTNVLTPQMHLTEVVDAPPPNVKVLVAMYIMQHILSLEILRETDLEIERSWEREKNQDREKERDLKRSQ